MLIGGYLPTSFSDFPGRIAAVIFTQGCNFRCPYCHNPELLPQDSSEQWCPQTILQTVAQRKGQLEGVVVSGGEPTLHNDLPQFLQELRRIGLPVKLDTNGSHPAIVQQILAHKLVDYIAMDIKAPWAKYPLLAGVTVDTHALQESVAHIATSGISCQFRTTIPRGLLDEVDLRAIDANLPHGHTTRRQTCTPQYRKKVDIETLSLVSLQV